MASAFARTILIALVILNISFGSTANAQDRSDQGLLRQSRLGGGDQPLVGHNETKRKSAPLIGALVGGVSGAVLSLVLSEGATGESGVLPLFVLGGVLLGLGIGSAFDDPDPRIGNAPNAHFVLRAQITSAPGPDRIDLTWTYNATTKEGFRIERREEQTGAFMEIAAVEPGVRTYTDQSVDPAIEYCYRVVAFSEAGSIFSTTECITTQ